MYLDLENGKDSLAKEFGHVYRDTIKSANCTFIFQDLGGEFGEPDEHGNYSGLIGRVQRHEFDMAINWIRIDNLDYEPVIVGPIFSSADVAIISGRHSSNISFQNIIESNSTMKSIVVLYSAIIFIILYSTLVLIKVFNKNAKIRKRTSSLNVIRTVFKTAKRIMYYFIGRNYNSFQENTSWRILIIIITISHFVIITGYHKNLVKVDMTVIRAPSEIDSLRDLLERKDVSPMVFKLLHVNRIASKSDPNSDLGRFAARIHETNSSMVQIDLNEGIQVLGKLREKGLQIIQHKTALCIPRIGYDIYLKLICSFEPEFASQMRISQHSFAHGSLAFFYSKAIKASLRKYFDHKLRIFREHGIYKGYTAFYRITDMPMRPPSLTGEVITNDVVIKCMFNLGSDNQNKGQEFKPFNFEFVKSGLILMMSMFACCLLVFALEHVCYLILRHF